MSPEVTDELAAQVEAIWCSRGIAFDARRRDPGTPGSAQALYILLERRTPADCNELSGRTCRIHMGGTALEEPVGPGLDAL